MYGLMKARCGDNAHKETRRLHYCGTCKTLGTLYGPSARMLLNHDAVFLGELLTALTPAAPAADTWTRAYQSYNCFALPRTTDDLPLPLRFAAASNILLTEFKLADQIADGGARHWRIARRWLARPVRQATAQLQAWGFPLGQLWALLPAQAARETEAQPNGAATLDYVAAPTATATALFFRCGAQVAGLSDAVQTQMRDLGAAFGRLVYLLDALEDYAQDVQRKEFNAFRTAYGWTQPRLDAAQRTLAARAINAQADAITLLLQELPLPADLRESFTARLWGNLRARLAKKRALPVLSLNSSLPVVVQSSTKTATVCATHPRLTWGERWHKARTIGRNVTAQTSAQTAKLWHYPHYLAALTAVTLTALVWPQQAAQARSGRECLAFGFNLMFLGALAGLVASRFKPKQHKHLHLAPLAMAAVPGGYGPNPSLPESEATDAAQQAQPVQPLLHDGDENEKRSQWCDGCDCPCDCCGECGNCCNCCDSCSCDGCNCCDGCCDCSCDC